MVKELMEAGLKDRALLDEVMRITGLPAPDAAKLIAIETGQIKGDTVPPDKP